MRNILSYGPTVPFTGQEIHDWVNYQLTNNTGHVKMAKKFLRFTKGRSNTKPISLKGLYTICLYSMGTAAGEVGREITLTRVDKKKLQ